VDSAGNIYVSDFTNYRIRKISASTGSIVTFGGTGSSSTVGTTDQIDSVSFYRPYSIVGNTGGTLFFISDGHYVWKYVLATNEAPPCLLIRLPFQWVLVEIPAWQLLLS
jgi:hypothetical protein